MEHEKKLREVYEADIDLRNCVSCVKFEEFKKGRKTGLCYKCVMENENNRFGWERYPNLIVKK